MQFCSATCLGCAAVGFATLAAALLLFVLNWSLVCAAVHEPECDEPMEQVTAGERALVVVAISEQGVGEICLFGRDGPCFVSARSADATPLYKGSSVVVIRYQRGIAHVRPV